MPALAWAALGFLLVATVAGIAFAATRGLAAWRALRSLQRQLEPRLADVNARVATLESRVAAAPGSSARLEQAVARLRSSLAEAALIADGVQDAKPLLRVARLLRS